MNVVLIIPTGIGAEIGGHAGDATPVAKLIGACCDNLITHPNVVNASDINEMPPNTLYVEGSMLNRFLEGKIKLRKVKKNRVLVVTNPPLKNEVINSVSAARATIGMDARIIVLKTPLEMVGKIMDGKAGGIVIGWEKLVEQVKGYDFDALAITTPIDVERETKLHYFRNGGINPWGGVEALASKMIATTIKKPVAHSPVENTPKEDLELLEYNEVTDPRMAAEMVSVSYLHCILKGLHQAPQPSNTGLGVEEVDFMISPFGCYGPPHIACREKGIPVIFVKENRTCLSEFGPIGSQNLVVENYLEAAGRIMVLKAGIDWRSVRRPLASTEVING